MGEGVGTAIARARAFVLEQGTPFARARLHALLREAPPGMLVAAFERCCDARGAIGRPDAAEARADVVSTAVALETLESAGALDGPLVERAARFLAAAQREDGAWTGIGAGFAEPLALTGFLCGQLAKTTCARPAALARADAWLVQHWSEERVRAGDYVAIAAFSHAFANLPSELSDAALQWCGRELERGFRSGRFAALATARIFVRSGAHALPGARLHPAELVAALLAAQEPDGAWPGGAPAERVDAALEALWALRHLAPESVPC